MNKSCQGVAQIPLAEHRARPPRTEARVRGVFGLPQVEQRGDARGGATACLTSGWAVTGCLGSDLRNDIPGLAACCHVEDVQLAIEFGTTRNDTHGQVRLVGR